MVVRISSISSLTVGDLRVCEKTYCARDLAFRRCSESSCSSIYTAVPALRRNATFLRSRRFFHKLSLDSNARQFGNAARGHWGVENCVHWILDVTFREDECRIRRGEAAENLSTLRHFVLNLLKQEKTLKKSIKQKRLMAAWDDDYRSKVLFGQ
ncbi:MAG: ISAs1 family transposase [Gammaproteobacteria bacterium]